MGIASPPKKAEALRPSIFVNPDKHEFAHNVKEKKGKRVHKITVRHALSHRLTPDDDRSVFDRNDRIELTVEQAEVTIAGTDFEGFVDGTNGVVITTNRRFQSKSSRVLVTPSTTFSS